MLIAAKELQQSNIILFKDRYSDIHEEWNILSIKQIQLQQQKQLVLEVRAFEREPEKYTSFIFLENDTILVKD